MFYPMSATLTIFSNVLMNPLCPRAEEDLDLLKSAPELINCIRTRPLTPNESMHMKTIEEFAAEMYRLGNCAIRQARKERNS